MSDEIKGSVFKGSKAVTQNENQTVDPRYLIQSQNNYIDVKGLNDYVFMMNTYKGSEGYRTGYYLTPFMKECFYETRCRCALYKNILKAVIDAMVTPVFNDEIKRDINDNLFEEFIKNVDNAGTSLDNFSQSVLTHARINNLTFVVIDNHVDVEGTIKDTLDKRLFPYMYEKLPHELKCVDVDELGKPLSYTFYDKEYKNENKTYQTFREWTDNESIWFYYKKNDKEGETKIILDTKVHGLGIIPVVPVNYFMKSKCLKEMPVPDMYNLAMLTWGLFNKESWATELEMYQTFSILVIPGMDPKTISLGPTNFISPPVEAKKSEYISPETDNTRVLIENCDRLKQEIYEEAGRKGVYAVKEQQSGIAKEWDFRSEEQVLKETSKAGVAFEQAVAVIFGKYINKEIKLESKYPEDFSPQYYNERVEMLVALIKEMPPPILLNAFWSEVAEIVYKQEPEKGNQIIEQLKEKIESDGDKEIDE